MSFADRKILVAVDFGTTFSGLAWAQTQKPKDIHPIEIWPDGSSEGLDGTSKQKVPTEIRKINGKREWGFEIGEGWRYRFFKLDLDPDQPSSSSAAASKYAGDEEQTPSCDPEATTIDYLTALREHTDRYLRQKVSSAALRNIEIEYIITTPAVWSEAAQAKTRRCAEAAGMGRGDSLQIVSEPEAAAIYAFDVTLPHDMQIGDTFVLCDAGGGTVDLISYTVTATTPILKVDEAGPGTGKLCGGMFLNRIFEKHLVQVCRSNSGWDADILEDAIKRFELIKQQFSGKTDKDFSIPVNGLQDNAAQGVRRGKWNLSGNKMALIFSTVVDETVDLVMEQIRLTTKKVTAVLLVGGWGQNAYLRETLRNRLGKNIKVMQPVNGWQAVVRGALMKALARSNPSSATFNVGSRVARKHYGYECYTKFLPDVHGKGKKEWRDFEGDYGTMIMRWLIKKDKPVREDKPTVMGLYYTGKVRNGPVKIELPIYSSQESTGAPLYRNNGMKHLVNLIADLSSIPESSLHRERGKDKKMWYKIDYQIVMTSRSASTDYVLRYKGKEYGSVSAEYV